MTQANDHPLPQGLDFNTDQLDAISDALQELRQEAHASCALVADITGQLIEAQGTSEHLNTAVLSALAAGEVAATRELARLVGEAPRFKLLLHEGKHQSIYLSDISEELVLVAIFDNSVPIGMVRLFTRMVADRLKAVVDEARSHRGTLIEQPWDENFGSLLAAQLDISFDEEEA
jgi:predicted regulator of Ras-like GTPase activity (Roadblock/LC7/MglB family)